MVSGARPQEKGTNAPQNDKIWFVPNGADLADGFLAGYHQWRACAVMGTGLPGRGEPAGGAFHYH